ncbi:ankyrin-1 [Biomphalaria glabrata]|uniref:Ankyrin-1-like n=1 Tax=Biomphalaria glabrata TaxID=6526 RepID=A0A9W2YE22_BIOGL|nr:ankyrin-1-like [Biomphalaria glabrata]XP_013094902.2 ankyrin-1-like [Biomphalaria glabrata]XP_055860988.1 ankyrin-1-like [Biomphalaria glabrata]XP_055860989.1 ankyrin-1-like [Biomphalaria glabrata]KAI8743359.1 ankyrin-1-like [Biomphalaria glabrata]
MTRMLSRKDKRHLGSICSSLSQLNDDLVIASRYGDAHKVSQLLQIGARIDYWPKEMKVVDFNNTPFRDPSEVSLEELLFHRSMAIYTACNHGHLKVILLLFKHLSRRDMVMGYWLVLLKTYRNKQSLHSEPSDVAVLNSVRCIHNILFTRSSNMGILKELIDAGADPNAKCLCGMTPLVSAVSLEQCDMEVVHTLLQSGASPNLCCKDNVSPLSMAAKFGNLKAMETLLQYGADASLHNRDWQHPLVYSVIRGDAAQVKLLLNQGLRPFAMLQFVVHAHHSLAFQVHDCKFFDKHVSLLYIALYCGMEDVAQLLLEKNFVTIFDLRCLQKDQVLYNHLCSEQKYKDTLALYEKIQSKPWSLFTFCFFVISEQVGFGSERREKLGCLGLPNLIVRKLLFSDQ